MQSRRAFFKEARMRSLTASLWQLGVKPFLRMSSLCLSLFGLNIVLIISVTSTLAHAQFVQGTKLSGSAESGAMTLGFSISLSADGNTAVVGSPDGTLPLFQPGLALIYTRSLGVWSQEAQLSGWTNSSNAQEGDAVAISSDGTTVILGGPGEGLYDTGAAWIFTRDGNGWRTRTKLGGSGHEFYETTQGASVALSADGNTAIVGAPSGGRTGNHYGCAWIYIRSGDIWTLQGPKLSVPEDSQRFGTSVALSADGNTAFIGTPGHEYDTGGAYVFTRTNGVWSRSGLISSADAGRGTLLGSSISVSADGKTVVLGGPGDHRVVGGGWIFKSNGNQWAQQGPKLVGPGAIGDAKQGTAVSMSSDGHIVIVGGPGDNGSLGAAWSFAAAGPTYLPLGPKLTVPAGFPTIQQLGRSVSISGDGLTAFVGDPFAAGDPLAAGGGAVWVYDWPAPPPISLSDYKTGSPAVVTCPGASKIISGGGLYIVPSPKPIPGGGETMCAYGVVKCPVGQQTCSMAPNTLNCVGAGVPGVSIAMVQAVCQAAATR
jgi:hypothetical protein